MSRKVFVIFSRLRKEHWWQMKKRKSRPFQRQQQQQSTVLVFKIKLTPPWLRQATYGMEKSNATTIDNQTVMLTIFRQFSERRNERKKWNKKYKDEWVNSMTTFWWFLMKLMLVKMFSERATFLSAVLSCRRFKSYENNAKETLQRSIYQFISL